MATVSNPVLVKLEALPVGSTIERTTHGWDVKVATAGSPQKQHGSGATLAAAFASVGTQLEPTEG